jgi:predicted O-methyltransferase YrrM
VQFLENYLNRDSVVLEFGMGGSTLWLHERVGSLTAVEHSQRWYNAVLEAASDVNGLLASRSYASVCQSLTPESFDLVLVDGRDRVKCVLAATPLLKRGGVMMLDNADRRRYRKAHATLDKWDHVATWQKVSRPPYDYRGRTDWWIKPA